MTESAVRLDLIIFPLVGADTNATSGLDSEGGISYYVLSINLFLP